METNHKQTFKNQIKRHYFECSGATENFDVECSWYMSNSRKGQRC